MDYSLPQDAMGQASKSHHPPNYEMARSEAMSGMSEAGAEMVVIYWLW